MARLTKQASVAEATLESLKQEEVALADAIAQVAAADKSTELAAARIEDARNADIPRVK